MPSKKVPDMPAADPFTGTEEFHLVQGPNSRHALLSGLATWILAQVPPAAPSGISQATADTRYLQIANNNPTATGPSGQIYVGGPSPHQYWRARITGINGSAQPVVIAELQLRETAGTAQVPSGGSAVYSSSSGGQGPGAAFDGNINTVWQSAAQPTPAAPEWIGYNYGVGAGGPNKKAINEIAVTNTYNGVFGHVAPLPAEESPTAIDVQWSDDGAAWTTEWSITGIAWTGAVSQTLVFTHPHAGQAAIATQNYPTALAALNDVSTAGNGDGKVLTYVAADQKWEPRTPAVGGGGGPTNYTPMDWTDYNPLTAHRYWRLLFTSGLTIAELYLADGTGTNLAGTWSTNNSGNGAAANVADGNAGTFWGSGANATTAAPNWLMLDLGAGVTAIVDQILMTARTSFQSQTPNDFKLQFSDDNATWTDATGVAWAGNWGSGQRKIFRARPYIVQFYFDCPNIQSGGSMATYSELEILAGTSDLTVPASTSDAIAGSMMGTSDGNDATNVFNNNPGVDYTGNASIPQWTEYRFGANPGLITGVSVTARSGQPQQAPGALKIRCSRDGLTYRTVWQSQLQLVGWGGGEKRYFSLEERNAIPWSRARFFLATATNSPANAWGKVPLDWGDQQGIIDDMPMWDGTNKRFVPKKAGYYLCNARACTNTTGTMTVAIAKNGARMADVGASGSGLNAAGGSTIIYCNGTTDYLELYCFTDTARALTTTSGANAMDNYMEVMGPL